MENNDGMSEEKKYNRKSIRLPGYDYSQPGDYFVTICIKNRECYFGKYQILRNIIRNEWRDISNRYPNVSWDSFVIMPNHLHGVIVINDSVGAPLAGAPGNESMRNETVDDIQENESVANNMNEGLGGKRAGARPAPTLGQIIGSFKSLCIHHWLNHIKSQKMNVDGLFWQRNYYEHIIRSEQSLNNVREYIFNNPANWCYDLENLNYQPLLSGQKRNLMLENHYKTIVM